jgi:tRNA 2-thiouridine synthesizing protein A
MPTFDNELDTSGLNCPMPVMKCKKMLQSLAPGQVCICWPPMSAPGVFPPGEQDRRSDRGISEANGKFHHYIKGIKPVPGLLSYNQA